MFYCSLYYDLSEMSFISDEFFWLDEFKKLLFVEFVTEDKVLCL